METIFIPDTLSFNGIDPERYFILQNLYRAQLEKLLKSMIDFHSIDKKLKEIVKIPVLNDFEYNYYHKNSTLNSNYVYVRNNIHVENLTSLELQKLEEGSFSEEEVKQSIERVLFEEGDMTFFGLLVPDFLADSKSLVFEFAYDQTKITNVGDLSLIDEKIKEIRESLVQGISQALNIRVSFIVYNGIPDIYYVEEDNPKLISGRV